MFVLPAETTLHTREETPKGIGLRLRNEILVLVKQLRAKVSNLLQ
jgi:hypothetical protein